MLNKGLFLIAQTSEGHLFFIRAWNIAQ